MIDVRTIKKSLLPRLLELPPGHALDVRTYKRNRSAVFVRLGPEAWRILENGYETRDFSVSDKDLARAVKGLMRREFPRSNKVRVYALGPFDPGVDSLPALKKV